MSLKITCYSFWAGDGWCAGWQQHGRGVAISCTFRSLYPFATYVLPVPSPYHLAFLSAPYLSLFSLSLSLSRSVAAGRQASGEGWVLPHTRKRPLLVVSRTGCRRFHEQYKCHGHFMDEETFLLNNTYIIFCDVYFNEWFRFILMACIDTERHSLKEFFFTRGYKNVVEYKTMNYCEFQATHINLKWDLFW